MVAGVLFQDWADPEPLRTLFERIQPVAPYETGKFYKRELPCLLTALRNIPEPLRAVVVDGYVWLRDTTQPGLGAHLYEALGRTIPVIGVAKTAFAGSPHALPVQRGDSRKPLFVTAAGIVPAEAARCIESMHGPYRLPTLLKRVDLLCREAPASA